jgi:hypothetical protein
MKHGHARVSYCHVNICVCACAHVATVRRVKSTEEQRSVSLHLLSILINE